MHRPRGGGKEGPPTMGEGIRESGGLDHYGHRPTRHEEVTEDEDVVNGWIWTKMDVRQCEV